MNDYYGLLKARKLVQEGMKKQGLSSAEMRKFIRELRYGTKKK